MSQDGVDDVGADPSDPCEPIESPEPPESEELRRARQVLGVERGASAAQRKECYRDLCRRYHPDRFASDPIASERATELTREVTRAYRLLEDAAGRGTSEDAGR